MVLLTAGQKTVLEGASIVFPGVNQPLIPLVTVDEQCTIPTEINRCNGINDTNGMYETNEPTPFDKEAKV